MEIKTRTMERVAYTRARGEKRKNIWVTLEQVRRRRGCFFFFFWGLGSTCTPRHSYNNWGWLAGVWRHPHHMTCGAPHKGVSHSGLVERTGGCARDAAMCMMSSPYNHDRMLHIDN
jgi:hypothetical protein